MSCTGWQIRTTTEPELTRKHLLISQYEKQSKYQQILTGGNLLLAGAQNKEDKGKK